MYMNIYELVINSVVCELFQSSQVFCFRGSSITYMNIYELIINSVVCELFQSSQVFCCRGPDITSNDLVVIASEVRRQAHLSVDVRSCYMQ